MTTLPSPLCSFPVSSYLIPFLDRIQHIYMVEWQLPTYLVLIGTCLMSQTFSSFLAAV